MVCFSPLGRDHETFVWRGRSPLRGYLYLLILWLSLHFVNSKKCRLFASKLRVNGLTGRRSTSVCERLQHLRVCKTSTSFSWQNLKSVYMSSSPNWTWNEVPPEISGSISGSAGCVPFCGSYWFCIYFIHTVKCDDLKPTDHVSWHISGQCCCILNFNKRYRRYYSTHNQ